MDQKTPLNDKEPVRFPYFAVAIQPYTVFRLRRTIFASSGTVKYSLDADPVSPSCLLMIAFSRGTQTLLSTSFC